MPTEKKQLKKDSPEEAARKKDFCLELDLTDKKIKALGSIGLGCGHTHSSSSQHTDVETSSHPGDLRLRAEETEDLAIQIGKIGEFITSLGGSLAIGPILDILLTSVYPKAKESAWFVPNDTLQVSPAILLISLMLVVPAAYGAPYCHAKLEIASRERDNFITSAKYWQQLLHWGDSNRFQLDDQRLICPTIQERPINRFIVIDPEDVSSLSCKEKCAVLGDVEQHFNEYIGLTVIAILKNIHNPIAQFILIGAAVLIAGIACKPEVTTCFNTLIVMNEFEKGRIIDNPNASNQAGCQTKFSAIAKSFAILYANFLSFQQICFGNFYAGLTLAIFATTGNIFTQLCINANTESIGEAQKDSSETVGIEEDNRSAWQKLTFFGKGLIICRAFGTGNERSEPITLTVIALTALTGSRLSSTSEALLALGLCLPGTLTAYSEARNAEDHLGRHPFFYKAPSKKEDDNDSLLNPFVQ
ncbi:MAG: hypothetical protein V4496_03130 [Pseudomonadota bacterium]